MIKVVVLLLSYHFLCVFVFSTVFQVFLFSTWYWGRR